MSMTTSDFLVIGGGVIGASTAYNLAANRAGSVNLLERGDICSGGTAKSCAIVRTHYSIESNMRHAVESLKIFSDFDNIVGGEAGWQQTGYIILGPEAHREPMLAVFARQQEYGIDTRVLERDDVGDYHPLLDVTDVGVIGYDSRAGYADPYLTTTSYIKRARELGVKVHTDTAVTGLAHRPGLIRVTTNRGDFASPVVIVAAGPWTNGIMRTLGLTLPYEVSRHKVVTLRIEQTYERGWPIVKDLTTADKIYFRPDTGGVVLVGTGDHGDPIDDPDGLIDRIDHDHLERIATLVGHRMPSFADAQYVAGWTGPYDITPDWNPIIGQLPGHEGLYVAVGFSGHGFKLAPTVGESLAQTAMGQSPRLSITEYGFERLENGQPLLGAYGIGSIS